VAERRFERGAVQLGHAASVGETIVVHENQLAVGATPYVGLASIETGREGGLEGLPGVLGCRPCAPTMPKRQHG